MAVNVSNPILPGFNPDPSICRVGDDYYIATSTFEWYPGVQIHHSRDLVNWTLVSRPLNRADLLDMTGNPDSCGVWAPCLTWHDGRFYLIYTDVKRFDGNFKDAHNYLTTCETIDGQWSERVYLNSSGFDPSLFHDDDGKKYLANMLWDHRDQRNRFGGILLQEYSEAEQRLVGPVHNIFKGTDLALTEGPHLYKLNGYYYLLTAEGGTGYTHAMTFARSKNLLGPYEIDPIKHFITAKDAPDNPIQRAGHGDIVQTPEGEWYAVHLCGRPFSLEEGDRKRCPMGRETALEKIEFTDEGWFRKSSGKPDPDATTPVGIAGTLPGKQKRLYSFETTELDADFQWLRIPDPSKIMSLSDRAGYLRLYGHESLGSLYYSALIARRQTAYDYTATTCVEFHPENIQQMAGLTCYYNAHKFHYLFVGWDEEIGTHLNIMSCEGDETLTNTFPIEAARIPVASEKVYLRAEVARDALQFSWSDDGEEWRAIDCELDYSLISDEAGKGEGANFTGAFVGMCCQDISGQKRAADFSFFDYREE